MNKRIIIIGISIVGVVLLVGLIVFFMLRGDKEQTLIDEQGNALSFIGNLPQSGNTNSQVVTDDGLNINGVGIGDVNFGNQVVAKDLKTRAANFMERLGSYSSDSNLSNFDDVLPQTAAELELILRSTKQARLNEFKNSESFIGYTVTSVTTEADVSNIDTGSVNVVINAIRQITGEKVESIVDNNVVYVISWILGEDGVWRINGVSGDF